MPSTQRPISQDLAPGSAPVTAPPYLLDLSRNSGSVRKEGLTVQVVTECLRFDTTRGFEFIDITDGVTDAVTRSGIRDGFAVIFSRHTTAAVRINENEPGLLRDMESLLERIAPRSNYYLHNDLSVRTVNVTEDEDANGHAHCQHLLLGASECVPIVGGQLQLGRWQRLFLIELDKPRSREVLVQLMGV